MSALTTIFLCTVRGCAQPLRREERRLVCARGHSFDVARSGYTNLLQPQDRRSRHPGDTRQAVEARRRFADRGFVDPLLRKMIEIAGDAEAMLDIGCGDGYQLDAFRRALQCEAHGLDISTPAVDLAARRYRECHFVVANADRFLPYADGSFSAISSITSRINAPEFRRVLRNDGKLLIALAGPDDLIELREAVLGEGKQIDRVPRALAELQDFQLARQENIVSVAKLDAQAIHDVMESSYRGLRKSQQARLASLDSLEVTLSRDVLLFRSAAA
jgi:23S rRNA (guanine745-N1)-methyltransferase